MHLLLGLLISSFLPKKKESKVVIPYDQNIVKLCCASNNNFCVVLVFHSLLDNWALNSLRQVQKQEKMFRR